ncbi:MAG: response regulator [Salibacteraceae bacterium]|nr:response regulator [Salibacteraceae bacterium]
MANKALKIGVVEDEGIIAENIVAILELIGYKVGEVCDSYDEAINMINEFQPDLVILDIHIKGEKSGIDVAKYIREEQGIPFIFLTSHSDEGTLAKAKALNPSAYLVKPFNKEDLKTSIEIALYNHNLWKETLAAQRPNALKNSLFIKDKEKFYKVDFTDIAVLESDHVYIDLTTVHGKKYTVRGSMEDYLAKLPADMFFRTHRSYIINLRHLTAVDHVKVEIANRQIPISRRYREHLFKLMQT